jgi:hypothetical protein
MLAVNWLKSKILGPGKPSGLGLQRFIESEQQSAWEEVGLSGRLHDSTYPFSGKYEPPKEVEVFIAYIMTMGGSVVVGAPIVPKEPLTSVYQEKLTFPILVQSWDTLLHAGQIPQQLREQVLLATVPSGRLYPMVNFDHRTGKKAILFNANLLFALITAAGLLSKLCAVPGAIRGETLGCWSEGHSVVCPKSSFSTHTGEILYFTSVLATLVRFGHPFVPGFDGLPFSKGRLFPRLVIDFYTFMLSHEIGHILSGHTGPSGSTADTESSTLQNDEFLADVQGFALYANATLRELGGNFVCYVHVSFCFYIMGLIYRTVNYFQGNKDYSLWTPDQMWRLYFPRPQARLYLHPLGRLQLLRGEIKKRAASSLAELDEWDRYIHEFFDSLWRQMYQSLVLHDAGMVHRIWDRVKDHHESCLNSEEG